MLHILLWWWSLWWQLLMLLRLLQLLLWFVRFVPIDPYKTPAVPHTTHLLAAEMPIYA